MYHQTFPFLNLLYRIGQRSSSEYSMLIETLFIMFQSKKVLITQAKKNIHILKHSLVHEGSKYSLNITNLRKKFIFISHFASAFNLH